MVKKKPTLIKVRGQNLKKYLKKYPRRVIARDWDKGELYMVRPSDRIKIQRKYQTIRVPKKKK